MNAHESATPTQAPLLPTRFRFRLRTLFAVISLCAVGSCCLVSMGGSVGYNLRRDRVPIWGLPDDATNICYYLPPPLFPNTYYEFDTSESSFLAWAQEHSRVRPDAYRPIRIYRYAIYATDADHRSQISIESGYLFSWTEEDRGVHLAYDKDTGRAYYWSHTR